MVTNLSICNADGIELPYAMLPIHGSPSGIDFDYVSGKVGLVRTDWRTNEQALAGALGMLGSVPNDIDCVVFEEYTDDEGYAPKWVMDQGKLDEIFAANGNAESIYDMRGERASLVPSSAFSLFSENEGRSPLKLRFTGNLRELACSSERAEKIEERLVDLARLDLVRRILTDGIAICDDVNHSRARKIFDCLLMGRVQFPLTDEEVGAAFHATGERFVDVFEGISFSSDERQSKHDDIKRAEELVEEAVILWDWSLRSFGVPFTISEWKCLREKGRSWNLDSMRAMGKLIGFDVMLDSLIDGIPLSDLIA